MSSIVKRQYNVKFLVKQKNAHEKFFSHFNNSHDSNAFYSNELTLTNRLRLKSSLYK